MKTEKEKQLEIALLTEKLQRISKKKVVLKEEYSNNDDYYCVVNKKENDEWMENSPSKPRPFEKRFKTERAAFRYAEKVNTEEDPYEIETPEGEVYQKEDGEWIVAFS